MDAEREERLRRRARWQRLTGIAGPAVAVIGNLLTHRVWRIDPTIQVLIVVPLGVIAVGVGVVSLLAARRTRRRILEGRKGDRWPLGELYRLAWQTEGSKHRSAGELDIGEEDFTLLPAVGASPLTTSLADVKSVRVRRAGIDVIGASGTLTLFPASYADRERLLWELAVRCPDAMERGMDESAPSSPSAPTPAPAPSASAPSASDEPPRGSTGLALGSALAGPMDAANPAPPRKSGLGVGLFAPPPGSKRTDE